MIFDILNYVLWQDEAAFVAMAKSIDRSMGLHEILGLDERLHEFDDEVRVVLLFL